jgi:signal transduction histidine kinase
VSDVSSPLVSGAGRPYLQAAIDALPTVVAIVDEDGQIIAVNRGWHSFAEVNGLSDPGHGLGTNYFDVCKSAVGVPDAWAAGQGIKLVLRGLRDSYQLEYASPTSREESWFRMTVSRIVDAGKVFAIVSHELEVEIIEARDALAFEEIVEEMATAFVKTATFEVDTLIKLWLEKIALALGVDRSLVAQRGTGTPAFEVTHAWAREGFRVTENTDPGKYTPWLLSKVLAGEMVAISRLDDAPPDAAIDIAFGQREGVKSIVAIPLKVGESVLGGVTFTCIRSERTWPSRLLGRLRLAATIFAGALERKRNARRLSELETEARQVSSVVMAGELTASLAHELNQPLGAILNNAQAARRLLGQRKIDLNEIGAALDDIIGDNTRAVDTIQKVRALFQRGEMKLARVDLTQLLMDFSGIVRRDAAARGISFRVEAPQSFLLAYVDRTLIIQVLMNLVLNAFESVSEKDVGSREVVVSVERISEASVTVAVRDSGKGIDPEVMPRLFDAFFTTKTHGMGMGLAMARTIVENHGGRLLAAQNSDQGATLAFTLQVESQHGVS